MRRYEDKQVTHTERQCVELRCDLCGRKGSPAREWETAAYEVNKTEVSVTVRAKQGEAYPEGGNGTEFSIDICPTCFREKLVPWLRSQGAKIEEREWSF